MINFSRLWCILVFYSRDWHFKNIYLSKVSGHFEKITVLRFDKAL